MTIAYGASSTLISITEDMKINMDALNTSELVTQNADEFIQQFNKFIQFHTNAKQLSALE